MASEALLKSRREEPHQLVPRFLYLATDPAHRIVKAGMSKHPDTRLAGYRVGCRLGRQTYSFASFSVIWTHPLGAICTADALPVERKLHLALRPTATYYEGEWYRMPAGRAIRVANRFARTLDRVMQTMGLRKAS